jgi:hypothetical protein
MKKLRRFVPVAVAVTIAGAAACGGGTGPGPQAASVTGVAGDSQTAPTGAALAFPLSFVALGSSGQPAPGVHVTWSAIPSGAATFNPATSTTDVNGAASTTATLGATVGSITIHAAVPGVSDVVYHATALDPCAILVPVTLGQTMNGALATSDCNYRNAGWYYDFYSLDLPLGQQSIRLSMHSAAFDTWVDFWSVSGPLVGFDDDSMLGTPPNNSQLDIILPGGSYIIGANSFNQFTTGAYTLATAARASGMNGCRQVWVVRGVTVDDSLTASDCADSAATPHHYDVARIQLAQGSVLTIAERSTVINPRLALYRILDLTNYGRSLVAQNDDSAAGNPNAFIRFPVTTTGPYDIVISSSAGGETGAYTFSVDTSTVLTSRALPTMSTSRAWWGRLAGEALRRSKH